MATQALYLALSMAALLTAAAIFARVIVGPPQGSGPLEDRRDDLDALLELRADAEAAGEADYRSEWWV